MSDLKREVIQAGRKLLLEIGGSDAECWAQNDKTYERATELADMVAQLVGYPQRDEDGKCFYPQVPAEPEHAGKAQGWIPVSERDPRDNEKVLVCNFRGEMRSGSFDSPTRDVLFRDGFWHLSQCTHWQPASPPTKDTTNG